MAGLCPYCNTGGAYTNSSSTSAVFCTPTLVPTQISIPTEAFGLTQTSASTSALNPSSIYTDENL